jgi:hypothetical protein
MLHALYLRLQCWSAPLTFWIAPLNKLDPSTWNVNIQMKPSAFPLTGDRIANADTLHDENGLRGVSRSNAGWDAAASGGEHGYAELFGGPRIDH